MEAMSRVHKPMWFRQISLMEHQNSFYNVLNSTGEKRLLFVDSASHLFNHSWQGLKDFFFKKGQCERNRFLKRNRAS